MTTAATRVFAVLGDPVHHSLSPQIQNAAFRAAAVDGVYVALRADDASFEGLVRGLAAAGGGGNVTLPHKARALALADQVLPAARRAGAANTFWMEEGRLTVDNTDVVGFQRALAAFLPGAPEGQRVLVLGAGGAARAVAVALLDGGAERVAVLNRTLARAEALVAALDDPRLQVVPEGSTERPPEADLVVNATRLGLSADDRLPLSMAALAETGAAAVFDLVYGAASGGTPWVTAARARGLAALDGREMLLHQGARAFERWWGHAAPLEAMRAALEAGAMG